MTIEVTAKKVDDAINQGLKQLGVGIDDVTVEVVESGGLFRKAKVRLTLDDKPESAAPSEEKSGKAKPDKPAEKKAAEKLETDHHSLYTADTGCRSAAGNGFSDDLRMYFSVSAGA